MVLLEQNKSGKWLAEQLGKSTCSVSKWCQNTVQLDLQTLDKNIGCGNKGITCRFNKTTINN